MKLIAISAVSVDGVIGIDDKIPWYIPEDFTHFKNTTMGHILIVGRATYLGLPPKALLGREYIVLSGSKYINDHNIHKYQFSSIDTILSLIYNVNCDLEKVYVAGGSSIYDLLIDSCDEAIITWVDKTYPDGNKRFPIVKLFTNFEATNDSDWKKSILGDSYKIIKYKRK